MAWTCSRRVSRSPASHAIWESVGRGCAGGEADHVDAGPKEGLSAPRRRSWSSGAVATVCWRRSWILKRASAYLATERPPRTVIPLVKELAADNLPAAVTCRVLDVPRSTYYEVAAHSFAATNW